MTIQTESEERPNIVLILTDEERHRGWLPDSVPLPGRSRLIAEGLEFDTFYAHTSPCSPSRASLFTGLYVEQHEIRENVTHRVQPELSPELPTIGHKLQQAGYYTAYMGKWHLSHDTRPDLERFGFHDWWGNDKAFLGMPGAGRRFDHEIAAQAVDWIKNRAPKLGQPWLLVVALINPHDVMWFPLDQRGYQTKRADLVEYAQTHMPQWWIDAEVENPLEPFPREVPDYGMELPASLSDDLRTKPAVQLGWTTNRGKLTGEIDPADTDAWRRQLDYYAQLHVESDLCVSEVLAAVDGLPTADNTVTVFTSDHGDMCGSHGLRAKGPFAYEEVMRIPLYVRAPGLTTPGSKTTALATHVDLAKTLVDLGQGRSDDLPGVSLAQTFDNPATRPREYVMFEQDMAWYSNCVDLRYALRGFFDGRHKYLHYYGVGGGQAQNAERSTQPKRIGHDASFEDQEHELYDLQEDPHELVNLAQDPSRAQFVRELFMLSRERETAELDRPITEA